MFNRRLQENIVELTNAPQPTAGASLPVIFSDEYQLKLAYYIHTSQESGFTEEATAITVNQNDASKDLVIIEFASFCTYSFGIPNHRPVNKQLFEDNIYPYGIFRVENSSWISALEKEQSTSSTYSTDRVQKCQHFVVYFQDSTFEVIAEDFEIRIEQGITIADFAPEFTKTMIC